MTTTIHTKKLQGKILQIKKKYKAKINILMDEGKLSEIFTYPSCVETATDGGFNPITGKSSYGCVIAANRILLAKGHGPAVAHPDLAESF
jgi:hypothetical protein